jgi:translation initiation factor IF-3
MTPTDAVAMARQRGLDLVEIAPNAQPPVCKIVNFGKWKYEQSKNQKDKQKNKSSRVKEIKLRPAIDPHDYMIKMRRAEDFLFHSHKVRFILQFRGRQLAHKEIGMQLLEKVIEDFKTMAHLDMAPRSAGKTISMGMSPLPESQRVRKFRAHDEEFDFDEDEEDEDDHDDHEDDHEEGDEDFDGDDHHEEDDDAHEAKAPAKKAPSKKKTLSLEEMLETEDHESGRHRHH